MADTDPSKQVSERGRFATWWRRASTLREAPSRLEGIAFSIAGVALAGLVWWFLTRGTGAERIVDPYTLPSPAETFASFPSLWFERGLSISAVVSFGRVLGGFLVATAIGLPFGLLAGSYLRLGAMLKPFGIFGRNVPIAALIPLTLIWFGLGEVQKVMFIFLASVAFVLFSATSAARAVPDRFLETAYTLGARRNVPKGWRLALLIGLGYGAVAAFGWHFLQHAGNDNGGATWGEALQGAGFWLRGVIGTLLGTTLWFPILADQALRKVVLPMSMPEVINGLRSLFGLAFGYIMLAEVINAKRGLGALIIISQRQGPREHIYLCLFLIALMAWGIDRLILLGQRHAFPYLKHADD